MPQFKVTFHTYDGDMFYRVVQCNFAHEAPALAALGVTWFNVAPASKIIVELAR